MARLSLKPDSSFFRKIAIGAVGTRAVAADLAALGHDVVELERGSTDTKLWKDVKRKRVRIPDLVCIRCGQRIESRAKTKAELAMSHSPTDEARAWDFGMVDPDWIAFPVCASRDEQSWTSGKLGLSRSYWHERNWIHWELIGHINYFTVGAFRSVPYMKTVTKGVTEGSETSVAWPALFSTRTAKIEKLAEGKITFAPNQGRRMSRKVPESLALAVAVGDTVQTNQLVASSVQPLLHQQAKCQGNLDGVRLGQLLASRERTQRFTGIKLARLRNDPSHRAAAERLLHDTEEDVYIRLEAASYLASVCSINAANLYQYFLALPDPQIRLEAVISLAEAGTRESVTCLSSILDDASEPHFLRSAAAWGLSRIPSSDAAHRLISAFSDVDERIREEALDNIASLGKDAIPALLSSLANNNQDIVAGSAEALRQHGSLPDAIVATLTDSLKNKNPSPWLVWLVAQLPRDTVALRIADLQDRSPALHYAVSVLWTFLGSWIAKHWEVFPQGGTGYQGEPDETP